MWRRYAGYRCFWLSSSSFTFIKFRIKSYSNLWQYSAKRTRSHILMGAFEQPCKRVRFLFARSEWDVIRRYRCVSIRRIVQRIIRDTYSVILHRHNPAGQSGERSSATIRSRVISFHGKWESDGGMSRELESHRYDLPIVPADLSSRLLTREIDENGLGDAQSHWVNCAFQHGAAYCIYRDVISGSAWISDRKRENALQHWKVRTKIAGENRSRHFSAPVPGNLGTLKQATVKFSLSAFRSSSSFPHRCWINASIEALINLVVALDTESVSRFFLLLVLDPDRSQRAL